MRVHVADHPLITHKLTVLRDKNTPSPTFRALAEELVTLLAYEATRNVRVHEVTIETPVAKTTGLAISDPRPLVVPILRAGLGMLEGMVKLVPTAEVGFLGMVRNEETLQPDIYAERLPDDLSNRQCFVLDPMLATGGFGKMWKITSNAHSLTGDGPAILLRRNLPLDRALLEPRVLENKASREEVRLLLEVCRVQKDKMCMALCQSRLGA